MTNRDRPPGPTARRERLVALHPPPRSKAKAKPVPRGGAKSAKSGRPPKTPKPSAAPRGPKGDDAQKRLYWIAGALVLLLIVVVILTFQVPTLRGWIASLEQPAPPLAPNREQNVTSPPAPTPAPVAPATPPVVVKPAPSPEEQLRQEVAREREQEVNLPPPVLKPKPAPPSVQNQPPIVVKVPGGPPVVPPLKRPTAPPARALPLDPNVLTTERIAAYQVALERLHFSCGFIDGDQGMRTQRMLRAFQASRGLAPTGLLDPATRAAIGEPGEPFLNYTVTAADAASLMPRLATWREKSQAARLGYSNLWELLGEKFHCTRAYLKALNPDISTPQVGSNIIGPKVFPATPMPQAAELRVFLSETSIEALDRSGRVVAFFPCSIAADKNKRPHGLLSVKVVDPRPDYTWDPELFKDAAVAEDIHHKLRIPPGPRNPVGTAWVGLSLPGYGIHGTPEPENISRTQSHGCFRLANWNADQVLKMVRVGTPVDVEP